MDSDLTKFQYNPKNTNRFISGMNEQEGIYNQFLTQDVYLDDNDVLLASPDFDITKNFNEVSQLLSGYNALRQVYHAKMRVYKGDHEAIKNLKMGNLIRKAGSKVMANLGKNVINTFAGTFASIPIKITYNDPDNQQASQKINDDIQKMLSLSNSGDVFFEWAKKADIYGRSYSVAYVNKQQETKFTSLSPESCFVVYDNTLDHNKLFAISYQNINGCYYGTLYTKDTIYKFSSSVHGASTDNSTQISNSSGKEANNGLSDDNWDGTDNPFGEVPISELPENDERSGLLDDIAPLMDQLDETLTAQHNDVMYFSNALLIVKGMDLDDDAQRKIKSWHVVKINNTDTDKLNASDIKYLDKPQNDGQQEHHIKHLKDEIYETSQVINLSDNELGSSASGDALEKKLQPMIMLADSKGRKMDAAIKDLLRIILIQSDDIQNSQIEDIISKVQVKFTINIPHNMVDVSTMVKNLNGIVSKNLLISLIPGVEDVADEINAEKQEQSQMANQYQNTHPEDHASNGDNNNSDNSGDNDDQ